jgi:hypothetical protein
MYGNENIHFRNGWQNKQVPLLGLIALVLIAGCYGCSSSSVTSNSPPDIPTPSTGRISLNLADAKPLLPAGTEKVQVTLSEISLIKQEGSWVNLPLPANPYTVDLLELTNGNSVNFVTAIQLIAGKYTQVRIGVTSATITIDGIDYPVEIPPESLQTDKNFEIDITKDGIVEITLDFDLSRSIVTDAPGTYHLQPVIHLVKTSEAAIIEGTLENTLFGTAREALVMLLSDGEEYTSLIVEKTDPTFRIYWLNPEAEYTLRVEVDGEIITEKTILAGDIQPASIHRTTIVNPRPKVKLGNWGAVMGDVVRYRSFNNTSDSELLIGPNPIASSYPNRVERNMTWTKPGAHSITITYDQNADTLSATMSGNGLTYSAVSEYARCPVGNWNVMAIVVVNLDNGTTVNLDNVTLGGYDLGRFNGETGCVKLWTVTNYDFTRDFTMTGTISLAGTFSNNQELSKIEFYMGCK